MPLIPMVIEQDGRGGKGFRHIFQALERPDYIPWIGY